MNPDPRRAEVKYRIHVMEWLEERDSKLKAVGISTLYEERNNGTWVTPTVEISTITDRRLGRAANLMSENHTTFTLEVIARLNDFAEIGGRYSNEAAAVIKALSELDRTHRVVELERQAQKHVNAARAAYEKACAIATYKP